MKKLKTLVQRGGMEALALTGAFRVHPFACPGKGLILTLHHVRPFVPGPCAPNRELEVTPEFLEGVLTSIRARGIDFVDLAEAARRLEDPAARRFAVVTFDDGYRDNREIARPIFRRHGIPFTVFVTSGFVDRTTMLWWKVVEEVVGMVPVLTFDLGAGPEVFETASRAAKDSVANRILCWARTADPGLVFERVERLAGEVGLDPLRPTRHEIMTRAELAELAADPLVTIGAHTRTHPNIRRLDRAAALQEMAGSADDLAGMIGRRPRFFAYPYGSHRAAGAREFDLAREAGFDLAVTTRPGMLHAEHAGHRTALPRVSLNGNFQDLRYLDVLLSGAPFMLWNRFRRLDVA